MKRLLFIVLSLSVCWIARTQNTQTPTIHPTPLVDRLAEVYKTLAAQSAPESALYDTDPRLHSHFLEGFTNGLDAVISGSVEYAAQHYPKLPGDSLSAWQAGQAGGMKAAFDTIVTKLGLGSINYPPAELNKDPSARSHAFKDDESGTTFYVESDGRHVAALTTEGKILWNRDPFADAHLEFYRTKTPRISYIGKPNPETATYLKNRGSGKFIAIVFNSSQNGVLEMKSGEFIFLGQE